MNTATMIKIVDRHAESPSIENRPIGNETVSVVWLDENRGRGVRALVPLAAGAIIHRFNGEIVSEIGQHTLQITPTQHISGTSIIGFLSHGCTPNARLDMERFALVATADIAAGEALTIDYALTEDTLFRQFACHCGDPGCRGWVTGRLEGPSADGQAYLAGRSAKP